MQLIGDRLLVEPIPHADKTPGGLAIPESAKPRYTRARVVQVGQGNPDKPLELKAGSIVLYFHPGVDFDFGGKRLKLITESELFAIE